MTTFGPKRESWRKNLDLAKAKESVIDGRMVGAGRECAAENLEKARKGRRQWGQGDGVVRGGMRGGEIGEGPEGPPMGPPGQRGQRRTRRMERLAEKDPELHKLMQKREKITEQIRELMEELTQHVMGHLLDD